MKPTTNPKTVKMGLKVAGIILAIAVAVVSEWEAGAITNASGFIVALANAVTGSLNEQP